MRDDWAGSRTAAAAVVFFFFFLLHLNCVGSILEMLGEILVIYAVYVVDEYGLV